MASKDLPVTNNKNNEKDLAVTIPLSTLYIIFSMFGIVSGSIIGYNRYLRQCKNVKEIPYRWFKRHWLYGKVTAVGDGDNFHLYHLPGGIFGGWGWIRSIPRLERNVIPVMKKPNLNSKSWFGNMTKLPLVSNKNQVKLRSKHYMDMAPNFKGKRNLPTIPVRISGIDAPERAHFGNKAQPFSDEALNWLRCQILGRRVWIKPLSVDQYGRCVARGVYWTWLGGWQDIGLQMIKEGLAVVYEGKTGAEFDGKEKSYRFHEFISRSQRKGLWIQRKVETPGQYKKKL